MSLARREEILVRLEELLTELKDEGHVRTVVRNRGFLDNDARPAVALLDGSETSKTIGSGRGRVKMSPAVVTMRPQIFGILKSKKPQNEGVGTELNDLRAKVLHKLAHDDVLIGLLGPNGDFNYDGMDTDLTTERLMNGEFQLGLSLSTVMNPYN